MLLYKINGYSITIIFYLSSYHLLTHIIIRVNPSYETTMRMFYSYISCSSKSYILSIFNDIVVELAIN